MSVEPAVPIEFKDRKTGLLIFGILTALMGAVCALFPPVMLLGQAVSARTTGVSRDFQTLIPGIVVFTSLATTFIWLGIGSMMARRWARALLLVISWSWLIVGIISIAFLVAMFPQLGAIIESARQPGQPEMPPAARAFILAIPAILLVVTYIVIPAVWIFFYGSRHVKATCEVRDPVVRWTDRCPLPILACVLWLAFGAVTMLIAPLAYRGVFPFFGTFATGPTGSAIYLVLAGVWAYAAWALYHLDRRGWWAIFVGLFLFAISAFITYSRHDVAELYRLMGTPEKQIAEIQKFNFLTGKAMPWMTLICTLPLLGYLVYVRKFLREDNAQVGAA
jgi:MFS family permease